MVTVGATVALPLNVQVIDVVQDLAPSKPPKRGGRSGGCTGGGCTGGGRWSGWLDEQPLSRENVSIVVELVAGLSLLPAAGGAADDPGAVVFNGADGVALEATAWMPGIGPVDGWLDQGEPWVGGHAPEFINLATIPWVTPMAVAVLVDVPAVEDDCRGDHPALGFELEKSLWLGTVPGPAVVGLALNWPTPWVPAELQPALPPSGGGTATFADFASLPWWRTPVATTVAIHAANDPQDHGRDGHKQGGHRRGGHGSYRPGPGLPGVLGFPPVPAPSGPKFWAVERAVQWSAVALVVEDGHHDKRCDSCHHAPPKTGAPDLGAWALQQANQWPQQYPRPEASLVPPPWSMQWTDPVQVAVFRDDSHDAHPWDYARRTAAPRPLATATVTPETLLLVGILGLDHPRGGTDPTAPNGASGEPSSPTQPAVTPSLAQPGLGYPWQAMALPVVMPAVVAAMVHAATGLDGHGRAGKGHGAATRGTGGVLFTGMERHTGTLPAMGLADPTGFDASLLVGPSVELPLQLLASALMLPVRVDMAIPGHAKHGKPGPAEGRIGSVVVAGVLDTWVKPGQLGRKASALITDAARGMLAPVTSGPVPGPWSLVAVPPSGPAAGVEVSPWLQPWLVPMDLALVLLLPDRHRRETTSVPRTPPPPPTIALQFTFPDEEWALPWRPVLEDVGQGIELIDICGSGLDRRGADHRGGRGGGMGRRLRLRSRTDAQHLPTHRPARGDEPRRRAALGDC